MLGHSEDTISPGIAEGANAGVPASNTSNEYRNYDTDIKLAFDYRGNSVVAGLYFSRAKGNEDGELDYGFALLVSFALERDQLGGYVETASNLARWRFNLGARFDDIDGFDSEVSYRVCSV